MFYNFFYNKSLGYALIYIFCNNMIILLWARDMNECYKMDIHNAVFMTWLWAAKGHLPEMAPASPKSSEPINYYWCNQDVGIRACVRSSSDRTIAQFHVCWTYHTLSNTCLPTSYSKVTLGGALQLVFFPKTFWRSHEDQLINDLIAQLATSYNCQTLLAIFIINVRVT